MTKLLQNRVREGLTKEKIETYKKEVNAARAKLNDTPVVDNEQYKGYDKMGPVKRTEATETIKVLRKYEKGLPDSLAMSYVDNGLSVYDNCDELVNFHLEVAEDFKRFKGLGGISALNTIKCGEEYFYGEADRGVEMGILVKNAIEKLPRSSDKKTGSKTSKGGDTPTPTDDTPTPK